MELHDVPYLMCIIIPRSLRLIGDFVFGSGGGKIVIKET